jgi:hypothetical protein
MTDPNASQPTPPASNPDPYASIPDAPQPVQPPQPTPYASAPNPYATNPYAANAPGATKSPVLSIIAMIAGILGLLVGITGWGLLISVAAVVLGHMGQRREKEAKAFWLTGIITGYAGVALNLVVFAGIILVFLFAFSSAPTV